MSRIKRNSVPEFIGQIIDIFEDFLDEKEDVIINPEIDESGEDNAAIICGADYDLLEDHLMKTMIRWNVVDSKRQK